MIKVLLIPAKASDRVEELELPTGPGDTLVWIHRLIGGDVQSIGVPYQYMKRGESAIAYIHAEGKKLFRGSVNYRATEFLGPGIGIFEGDFIAGPMVIIGSDIKTGNHTDIPQSAINRLRDITDK